VSDVSPLTGFAEATFVVSFSDSRMERPPIWTLKDVLPATFVIRIGSPAVACVMKSVIEYAIETPFC
jgi:hypothetical protein